MTPTQKGRRSDALFHDNLSRRDLCNKIADLEDRLERLRAERNKALEELARLSGGE